MAKPRLHLDASTSRAILESALLARGHDVTRTANPWMPEDASDEAQLLGASVRGRCVFTFDIGDFSLLAARYPNHGGVILATQSRWSVSGLLHALDRLLSETQAEDWIGRVRWLSEWRRQNDEKGLS